MGAPQAAQYPAAQLPRAGTQPFDARQMRDEIVANVGQVMNEQLRLMNENHQRNIDALSVSVAQQMALVSTGKLDKPRHASTPALKGSRLSRNNSRVVRTPKIKTPKVPVIDVVRRSGSGSDSDSENSMSSQEDSQMLHVIASNALARDMQKSIGFFSNPKGKETWLRYVRRFEKATDRHYVDKDRWADVLPDMLKGDASSHLDSEVESRGGNLMYDEIVDLLTRIFREFDEQTRACEELGQRVQLEDEGVAAFTSAIKQLAMKAYPESGKIRQRIIRERLYKGLRDERLQFETKRQVHDNADISMVELEKALCFMEPAPGSKAVTKQAVSTTHLVQQGAMYVQASQGETTVLYMPVTTTARTPAPAVMPQTAEDVHFEKLERQLIDVTAVLKEMQGQLKPK